jgi:hypothetical protein
MLYVKIPLWTDQQGHYEFYRLIFYLTLTLQLHGRHKQHSDIILL